MFDAVHARLDGGFDPGVADGVGGDRTVTVVMGFLDDRGDHLAAHAQPGRVVVGGGHPAAGGDFDDVRAGAQQLPGALACGVDGVDQVGADQPAQVDTGRQMEVGVPAALAEHVDRHQQARTFDEAVGDRFADTGVDTHQVPGCGHAVANGHPQSFDQLEVTVGRWFECLLQRASRRTGQPEVDVAVEEAGADGVAAEVDPHHVGGRRGVGRGPGPGDPVVVDQHGGVGHGGCAGAVDQRRVVQQVGGHGCCNSTNFGRDMQPPTPGSSRTPHAPGTPR